VDIVINAPAMEVFDAFTAWTQQDRAMMGTRVEIRRGDGKSVGSVIAGWTGAGSVGFWDIMEITRWEPPYRVDVLRRGSLVKGTGTMEVLSLPRNTSRFMWGEDFELPFGMLGAAGWPMSKFPLRARVKKSLKALKREIESGRPF
jgi:hypothetical protein